MRLKKVFNSIMFVRAPRISDRILSETLSGNKFCVTHGRFWDSMRDSKIGTLEGEGSVRESGLFSRR
jgi:hypothetical protein